jgi:hypothetical protein
MDKTKAFAGGGAWMVAAGLQVIPQTWPHLLQPHPWGVLAFVVIGAGMFVYAALGDRESGGSSKTQTARDVNGKMLQAETLHYHEAAQIPQHAPPQPVVLRTPNIVPVAIRRILVEKDSLALGVVHGDPIWILEIQNQFRKDGVEIQNATSVSASLEFRDLYDFIKPIPRACWYGHPNYEIEIPIEHTEQIILGHPTEKRSWISYENRRRLRPKWQELRAGYYEGAEFIPVEVPVMRLTVEVKVFSRHKGVPDMRRKYRLSFRELDGAPAFDEVHDEA